MKYQNEIIINAPREEVVTKMDNPDNMKYWQRGFVAFNHGHRLVNRHSGEVGILIVFCVQQQTDACCIDRTA